MGKFFSILAVFAATLFFAGKLLRMSNTLQAFFCVKSSCHLDSRDTGACVRRTGENLRSVGDRSIGVANLRKGLAPFLKFLKRTLVRFRLGASPRKWGLTVAPFGISASRNRQSPPNCPKFSGSGYVQTVALGKNCDGVRT